MKSFCILLATFMVGTCASPRYTARIENIKNNIILSDSALVIKYANTITSEELKKQLYIFSSDEFEGRKTGEIGQKRATKFLKDYYIKENISSPLGGSSYYQTVPESFLNESNTASQNVLAYIEGAQKPDEVIIISAHLDHLGVSDGGEIFNGADDDGSGTVALMEMAQAFHIAKLEGHGPKRSILFLHVTAEEIGKKGSEYYTRYPVFPLENTVCNLNIDMIGRVDDEHKNDTNYIYLIGTDRISRELHYVSEKVNNTYTHINLDYRYNIEDESNHYYSRSDQYNFAIHDIPVIFYFNGEHKDYHEISDTPDKIAYDLLEKRTKLIFATAWQLANQTYRLKTDENNELLK
ncbi:M28 family peptidase [Changchengzhania lutea]|uniref:M28 family peptidase n=1 Tax=Changchengzhania lutea TaxID=2049305 RepID=UPI00115EA358|nr:M28 family peptidase [Changchengzhania lutea]